MQLIVQKLFRGTQTWFNLPAKVYELSTEAQNVLGKLTVLASLEYETAERS